MSFMSRLLARLAKLPPAETYDLVVERDIAVSAPDGVSLLTDIYAPRGRDQLPTILARSPYGRAGLFGLLLGRTFAERGFRAVVQSCRGTFGSGGDFNPFRHERADGLATVAWIKQQPWFNGQLATVGPSYLGLTQWSVAREAGPELQAMSTWITSAEFRSIIYPGEAFWLESGLSWAVAMHTQEKRSWRDFVASLRSEDSNMPGYRTLPLIDAPKTMLGHPVQFWQDWISHDQPGDEWWLAVDFTADVPHITAPNLMIGGWYDIFLPQTLRDYQMLRQAGQQPYLTIGPWAHTDLPLMPVALRESLAWFRAHLLGDRAGLRQAPVRLFVMGANEWREYPDWPMTGTRPRRWHLQPQGTLSPAPPPTSAPDHYRYDPNSPTPSVGGASMAKSTGAKDNRPLEARSDVLLYTSAPLEQAEEYIGAVTAELYVQSSRAHTDFFVRLCDVDPAGKSTNITDQLCRIVPGQPAPEADGTLKLVIELWPMAYQFKKGHRLRVQVSSGAFPRWSRNPGTGEPIATAQTLHPAEQTIFHDPAHPSALILTQTIG
ncbi:MAG: CocE/NonD family hydrolase [Chloroflexi bacterium]|nr:CocE/NonD family hydrolase [Chloroflexota bacterium]MBP8056939.1 CocE/NonD family hydrolase [Chloroflexota bacterium]